MKHLAMVVAACLAFASASVGQQTSDNLPASKEDVQKYLDLMHSRDTMTKMWEAMSKQIRQMTHEEYLKHKDKLPSDFEVQENRKLDEMIKAMPFEELEQAVRSEEHTSELQSRLHLVCRLLLEKKKKPDECSLA